MLLNRGIKSGLKKKKGKKNEKETATEKKE